MLQGILHDHIESFESVKDSSAKELQRFSLTRMQEETPDLDWDVDEMVEEIFADIVEADHSEEELRKALFNSVQMSFSLEALILCANIGKITGGNDSEKSSALF